MIVVVADETELEGAEQIIGAALRDQAFRAGGIAVFRCHVPESRGGSVEVDSLVCTPQSVTIVEVKGFTARQEGTLATPPNGPWTIDGEPAALYHAVRVPNPFVQVRRQVFAAKSLLQQAGIFGWVNAVIALVAQPGTEITIEETRIADGYRAVLVDRDDAGALHDYFQAESGRTVRLSIDDVTRVFAALNLGHLLPSSDELKSQGFPAALDPATTSRPAAPTAVELGTPAGTEVSATPAGPTGSSQTATPAFLAAIDRLAHRSRPARPEEPTTPIVAEEVVESPTASAAFTDIPADDPDVPAKSATEVGSRGESAADPETSNPAVAESVPPHDPSPNPIASDAVAHHEPGAGARVAGDQKPSETTDRSPSAVAAGAPADGEVAEPPHRASESVVSLSKSPAGTEADSIGDPPADGPATSAGSSKLRQGPATENDDSAAGTPAAAGVGGPTVGAGTALGAAAALGTAAALGAAAASSSARSAPPTRSAAAAGSATPAGSAVAGSATPAGSAVADGSTTAAGSGETGSWSTPSTASSIPAVARPHRPAEPEAPPENSEHWSDWVERDRTPRRPTLSARWRAWRRRGNGPSLRERWHNRPVRERTAPRRGLSVGPGVALLLFIALFGAGFFAITAVQASRFEMSDYDRMCGEDKKPFPDAAPYQREGARPIYLSGELTAMVDPVDPAAWNPHDPSTVQLIACMKQLELRDLVQTCQYEPSPGTPIGRTVNLFRATYEIAVYELHTGREVAKATMLGERYSADPSNTDPDRCRAAADADDFLGRRLGQPSSAQLTGFLAPLVNAARTNP
ncbi:NERD domain-containing protein [Nocardia sp. A7]|uniref:NERD domain-containing protein n=1 Tax=Nocardia sp. A7 TaxID=2789274 RepID=UPI00397D66DA